MEKVNITCEIKDKQATKQIPTYEELMKELELKELIKEEILNDDTISLEIEYNTHYTKNELEKIAEYYKLCLYQKSKTHIINDIIEFEKNPDNLHIVYKRKKLWDYIKEIQQDECLKKYLNF